MAISIPRPLRTVLPVLAIILIAAYFLLSSSDVLSAVSLAEHGHIDAGGYDPHASKEFDDLEPAELKANLVDDEHRQHHDSPVVQEVTMEELAKDDIIFGGVIMDKLGNETAKAELGRAAWRVLHLTTLRFPDTPTPSDRKALESFMHLFSRLYPCGECATEFQLLLKEYPPQTSSRKSASLWLCHIHNLVNERLGKEEFDCLTLDKAYDCGCGDEGNVTSSTSALISAPTPAQETTSIINEALAFEEVERSEEVESQEAKEDSA